MATETEITDALAVLALARLRNAPTREEAQTVKSTWQRVMRDIPGDVLLTAADEIILAADFWPTPAEMRRKAAEVKLHNGKGKSTPFDAPYVRYRSEYAMLPDAYKQEHDHLKAKYTDGCGLPTDDELYALEMLSGRVEG